MKRRLIIDTDAKNEADDQYAIVHALLSPSLDIAGIVPAHFGERRTTESLRESREEVDLLLEMLGSPGRSRWPTGRLAPSRTSRRRSTPPAPA